MSNYTPGPWHYQHDKYEGDAIMADGPRWVVRRVEDPDTGYDIVDIPNDADARLIEASPDLYEALKEVYRVCGRDESEVSMADQTRAFRMMREAIAKAEGREDDQPA